MLKRIIEWFKKLIGKEEIPDWGPNIIAPNYQVIYLEQAKRLAKMFPHLFKEES